MLLGYGEGGEYGAGRGAARAPDERRRDRVPDLWRASSSRRAAAARSSSATSSTSYDADALRYYLVAASPETQDTEFTWAEFVRRNNDELLANWGNLVNRTLDERPPELRRRSGAGRARPRGTEALARDDRGRLRRGRLADRARPLPRGARRGDAALLRGQPVRQRPAPWALVKTDRDRAGTVLYVALRAVDSLKVIFTPFLPHTSQTLHELLGYEGWLAGPLEFREVDEEDGRTPRGADRRLRRAGSAAGSRASFRPGSRCASRSRSSASSTRRSPRTSSAAA